MKSIRTDIAIDAPPETIWQILTDFSRYPEWNPFIPAAEGAAREGETITVRIDPPGGQGMTFPPRSGVSTPIENYDGWAGSCCQRSSMANTSSSCILETVELASCSARPSVDCSSRCCGVR